MSSPLGMLFSYLHIRPDSPLRPDWSTKNLGRRYLRRRMVLKQPFVPMDPELLQNVTLFYLLEKSPDFTGSPATVGFLREVSPLLIDEADTSGFLYVRNAEKESVVLNINRPMHYEFDFSLTFYPKKRLATSMELRAQLYPIVENLGTLHGFTLLQDDIEEA